MERVVFITILLMFLFGYAFCAWGVPVLDSLFNTIALLFQALQGKIAIKITEDSVKVEKLKQELGEDKNLSSTHSIGFIIPEEDEEEDYYEDDK